MPNYDPEFDASLDLGVAEMKADLGKDADKFLAERDVAGLTGGWYISGVSDDHSMIAMDPQVLGGKAHIRGTRLSVELLLELMAQGASREQILSEFDSLTPAALAAALRFAASAVGNDLSWDVPASASA